MKNCFNWCLVMSLGMAAAACGSDAGTAAGDGTGGTAGGGSGPGNGGSAGAASGSGGTPAPVGSGGAGTSTGGAVGSGGAGPGAGGTLATGGAAGASGNAGTAGAGGAAGGGAGGAGAAGNALTGTLGALGAVKPVVSAWVVSNSGETLIYLSTAPLTCAMMQTSGKAWLPSVAAGAQVVEIVLKGAPSVKTYPVGFLQAEVNYAEGGKSSSYEVNATSGSVTFTKASANGPVEGTVTATYASGNVTGSFSAEFCANGSQY